MREIKVVKTYRLDDDDVSEDVYEFKAQLLEHEAEIGYIEGLFVPSDVEPLEVCDVLSQDYYEVAANLHLLQTSNYFSRYGSDIQTFNLTIIDRLWIEPGRRSQGLGSTFLKKFLSMQDDSMYSALALYASCFEMKKRERGRRAAEQRLMLWYEQLGFRRVSNRCNTMIMFPQYNPAHQPVEPGYTCTSGKPWVRS